MNNRNIFYTFTMIASQLLSGCAHFDAFRAFDMETIEMWVKQEHYGEALNALSNIPSENSKREQLLQRRQEIAELASQFERRSIEQVEKLLAEKKWGESKQALQLALDKYPESTLLQEGHKALNKTFEERQAQIEQQLLINEGRWRLENMVLFNELDLLASDFDITRQWELWDFLRQRRETSDKLVACGLKAVEDEDTAKAESCLNLAKQIYSTPESAYALRRLAELNRIVDERNAQRRQVQARKLVGSIKRALDENNLIFARTELSRLQAMDPNNPDSDLLAQRLDKQIQARLKKGLEEGGQLYSQGEVEAALNLWIELKKISPNNNELLTRIERAERVLENVRRMKSGER